MGVMVSLLRGVNLGSHHKINMPALRALYQSLKLKDAQTYVQSGNVLFRTEARDPIALAKRIEDGIERTFGFRPDVILRTTSQMRNVVARNPFAGRAEVSGSKLLVTFLASDPGKEAREEVRGIKSDPEEMWIDGSELYIYYPDGMGRSKLPISAINKALKIPGTARNWNSVTKLLEMAEEMEGNG